MLSQNAWEKELQETAPGKASYPVTKEMVTEFARISGDSNPIHLDENYAATTKFGKCIAHGALILSFISGLIAQKFPGAVVRSTHLKFKDAVYIGSIVDVSVVIMKIDTRGDWALITLGCAASVDRDIAVKGEFLILLTKLP